MGFQDRSNEGEDVLDGDVTVQSHDGAVRVTYQPDTDTAVVDYLPDGTSTGPVPWRDLEQAMETMRKIVPVFNAVPKIAMLKRVN